FELCSTIITGEIIDRQYESCDGLERQIYRAVYSGPDSSIVPTDKTVSLKILCEQRYSAGDTYQIHLCVFHHSVVDPAKATLTLVSCTTYSATRPIVIGNSRG